MSTAFSVFRKMEDSPQVALHGQVLTKPHVVELMLDLAGYHGDPSSTILDPGCGEGAFTIAAARRLTRLAGAPKRFEDFSDCILAIDKDDAAVAVCRQRLVATLTAEGVSRPLAERLSRHWVVVGDFLEHEFTKKFDLVIGNPPYVRQEAIPKQKLLQYRDEFECFYDRADLYVAFFERALKLLSEKGVLAFICPDRFAKNNYGRKLRAFISQGFSVDCVLDMAQASPFENDVTSYPGVFVLHRGTQSRHVDFFRLTEASSSECDLVRNRRSSASVTYHRYEGWFQGEQQWSIESPDHLSLLRRLEADFIAIGDANSGCRVGIGVATGADGVFIVDQDTDEVEAELLMPLVTTKDIASGVLKWRGQCVINPFVGETTELIDLSRYPRAARYFERTRSLLEGRNVAKRDVKRWYRTIDRVYPSLKVTPKLLIPDIKAENLIVREPGGLYPHHNLYYVASDAWDLRALRTILRSSVGKFFVWMYAVKMRGDFLRFQAQYLRRICIPRIGTSERSVLRRLLQVDSSDDQNMIDAAVAAAYRLSDADLELVRNIAVPRRGC